MAFLHEILIDRRDFHYNVFSPIRHTLATKP